MTHSIQQKYGKKSEDGSLILQHTKSKETSRITDIFRNSS